MMVPSNFTGKTKQIASSATPLHCSLSPSTKQTHPGKKHKSEKENQSVVVIMDKKEKAKEKKEKRRQEISLLRTIPYSDHQR